MKKLMKLVKAFRFKTGLVTIHEMIEMVQEQLDLHNTRIVRMQEVKQKCEDLASAPLGEPETYKKLMADAERLHQLTEKKRAALAECLLVLNILETTRSSERHIA